MQDLSPVAAPLILSERVEPGIAKLTLNRPAARNALSRDLMRDLHVEIERLGKDPAVAVIILAASGKVYSSGHDLKEMTAHRTDADGGEAFFRKTMSACSAMMQAIVACPKPVIAAVEGRATAAGCQLVATCDLAVAAETADFATPGVNIGLFCSTPMVALSRNVPRKRAMEMLLLGEALSASDALSFGLVNRVVAADKVMDEALGMARIIAAKSKATVAIGKAAFYRQAEMALDEAYAYASEVMVKNMMTADAGEGICAFIEKRHPEWKDK
ncbi:MAG: enoyl-CoA hydratase [Proteobacteria bacterium]|nr:enoyl-CoA hydratase [Pseudomonadota bacterium]